MKTRRLDLFASVALAFVAPIASAQNPAPKKGPLPLRLGFAERAAPLPASATG